MKNYKVVGCVVIPFIISAAFKIAGVIDWSWWWVTFPLWVPAVLALIAVTGFFCVVGYYSKKTK